MSALLFFSPADSRKIAQFRCLLAGILQELDKESVAFSEIIGVVLDGNDPSAPAGIPTCPHTASVTAPAGISLSLSHHSARLITFYILSEWIAYRFFFRGCTRNYSAVDVQGARFLITSRAAAAAAHGTWRR